MGTYKGASCMMLMNYFVDHEKNDFLIHSIDVNKYFRLTEFSKKTRKRLEKHQGNILFLVGDATLRHPDVTYDLVVIDGPENVYKCFLNVKGRARFILFDDLHLSIYEKTYKSIAEIPEVEELFCVYTTDDKKRDPHCIGLIKIKPVEKTF